MGYENFRHITNAIDPFFEMQSDEVKHQRLINLRIKHVYRQFKQVVQPIFLMHTNAVYLIKDKEDPQIQHLTVYVDNSTIAAELNARRELIRLKYRELFDVIIGDFSIRISKGSYRLNYPFKEEQEKLEKKLQNQPRPLTEKEKYDIETLIKDLPEGQLKESFRRAISAEKKHGML